jgi:ribonucleoside-diphosphate reductase alpha chain/ribonucleoside-triphosphate reductase
MVFLTKDFLKKYEGISPFKNAMSEFVYLRTYSRWLDGEKRRETWLETCERVVNYSFKLYSGPKSHQELAQEAEKMFDDVFKLRYLPAGRTLWVGGTEIIDHVSEANFNCSFTAIEKIEDIKDLFFLLMVGTGVGFSVQKQHIQKLPKFNNKIKLLIKNYELKEPSSRTEHTFIKRLTDKDIVITVGDSREAWADGLQAFLEEMTDPEVELITLNLDNVRPKGERLKRFGGKASGPEPYAQMIKKMHEIIAATDGTLKPVDVLDICNIAAENVVAGGVRRSAQLAMIDASEEEAIYAKKGYWLTGKYHRAMSNNSIAFWEKPTKEYLGTLIESIKESYEPGFINAEAANRLRPWFSGFNPCVEVVLANKGFCNLSTVFVPAFINDKNELQLYELEKAVRNSARHCLRITNADISLKEWDKVQKRDRLLGVNLTGVEDAFDKCGISKDTRGYIFNLLKSAANDEASKYAKEMRVPTPLLVTTIQPGGTLSQLNASGPCSPGFHKSFAPFIKRTVRISSQDALAKTVLKQGYKVYPDPMSGISSAEFDAMTPENQKKCLSTVPTWVVVFGIDTGAKMKASDESAISQLERYKQYLQDYSDHNVSSTIQVADDEWDQVIDWIYDNWDSYIGVSFQNKSNDKYDLPPYEAVTEEEYHEIMKSCPPIDHDLLNKIENGYSSADDDLGNDCNSGSCPIR